jgi:outer membrane receptor protein involved in Fe transport
MSSCQPRRERAAASRASASLVLPLFFLSFGLTFAASTLFPFPAASQTVSEVTGRVTDAGTGRPVEAANVHAAGAQSITDDQGRFRLIGVPAGAEIHVERLGYRPVVTTVAGSTLDVALEPAPVSLEAMVVEALGGAMLAHNSSLAITEIDESTITATAGTTLAEALDSHEGVSMSRVGSWGSRPVLRGLSGERLAVLIDGNRVSRACTFGMDMGLATIDPATVERVEILTGPGSTAYGSGNIGGVINVVTRSVDADRPFSGEVRASGSTAVPGGGIGGSMNVAGRAYAVRASVDASSFGDYRTPSAEIASSGYRQLTGDVKLEVEPSAAHRFSLGTQYYGARDIGWPMQGGAEIPEESRASVSAEYAWQHGGTVLDGLSARAYFQKLDHHMVMSMTMPGMGGATMTSVTDGKSYSETSGGRLQLRLSPARAFDLDVGSEVTNVHAEGTRWTDRTMGMMAPTRETFHTWPGVNVLDIGAFAQGDVQVSSALTATGGIRLDHVDRSADQGDAKQEWVPTGNVGLRASLTRWLSARGTVGFGFRTPDPMELYGLALKPDGFVYRGRADLDTERSLGTEVTLTAAHGVFVASVTGFDNRVTDIVVPANVSDSVSGRPVRAYQNLAEARIRGLSATVQSELPAAFQVEARATWTHGEDPKSDAPLPSIPPLEGGLALRRDFGGAVRWAEAEWQGAYRQRRVAASIGEVQTPGWGAVNLRAGAVLAGSDLTIGVENVFDHLYRGHLDPYTLFRPGRNFFVRVSRAF